MDPRENPLDIRGILLAFVVGGLIGFGAGVKAPEQKPKQRTEYSNLADVISERGRVRVVARVGGSWTLVDSTGHVMDLYQSGGTSFTIGEVIEATRP